MSTSVSKGRDVDWDDIPEDRKERAAWDEGLGAPVFVDLCHATDCDLNLGETVYAFVDRSIPHPDGKTTTFHVMLFQDHFCGMDGVTGSVARLLAARGRVGQWTGNALQPSTVRGIVTVAKDHDQSDISKEVRRQLLQPCAAGMASGCPDVVMLLPFGAEE